MDVGSTRRKSEQLDRSPEKYPKVVKEFVDKKIASENQFNHHVRVRRASTHELHAHKEDRVHRLSLTDNDISRLKLKYQRHHGDENLTDSDLHASRTLAHDLLEAESSSNEKGYDSDSEMLPHNVSPMMIRRHSHSHEHPQIGEKIDIHLAKLAQMKLKLDPLPNRRRTKSLAQNGL